ncbi:MAG: nucleoside monophosphate kinase [Puniceicoccales bacterium]|jgi:adenylate kinase|nr:nucleoside monophosphate kinase [Puniceicoccales bacterium]
MNLSKLLKILGVAVIVLKVGNVSAENEIVFEEAERIMSENIEMEYNEDIAEAQLLFEDVWEDLCSRLGEENLKFPKQIIFLNGAPGAGKGTNTIIVMRIFEISSKPIEISALLTTPECEELKRKGMLVGDQIVITQMMNEILKPENSRGIIIDGFPRTTVQAYFLRHLIDKIGEHAKASKPIFRMVNFAVSQQTSVERQLFRGTATAEQNKKAEKFGQKQTPVRATDLSEEAATLRFKLYEKSISECIEILRNNLEFSEINSEGTLEEVRNRIQNILELD